MQKKSPKKSHRSSKWIFWGFIIICGAVSLSSIFIFVFYYVAHPILCHIGYIPVEIYEDVTLFTEEKYLEYEYGKEFDDFINSLEFVDTGTPNYFYYGNNENRDNPFHGKMHDIYALDIKLNEEKYIEVKTQIINGETRSYQYEPDDNFTLYLPKKFLRKKCETGFALNDNECIVRCIMVTEGDTINYDITGPLKYLSTLSFD